MQTSQDKVCSCLLLTVLFAIMYLMNSTILKLHTGLIIFLNIICSQEFVRGYLFFHSIVHTCMLKQNHLEQAPMCLAKFIGQRIIILLKVAWVTDGGMLYHSVENEL